MAESSTPVRPHASQLVVDELNAGNVDRLTVLVAEVDDFGSDVVAKVRLLDSPAFLAWDLRRTAAGLWLTRVKRDSPSGVTGFEVREMVPWHQVARVTIVDVVSSDEEPF